jgi:protease-4
MSPENREQMTVLLNSVWSAFVKDIAISRKLSEAQLNAIATTLGARTPELALANKMIDKIAYEDEYHQAIRDQLKVGKKEKYNTISITEYAKSAALTVEDYTKDDIIAVIYAQGEILSGEGDVNVIGEGSIKRSLEEARNNDDVKAIVLRVDSPGGNALTSELIWTCSSIYGELCSIGWVLYCRKCRSHFCRKQYHHRINWCFWDASQYEPIGQEYWHQCRASKNT